MSSIFSLIRNLLGRKRTFKNDAPPTSEIPFAEIEDKSHQTMCVDWESLVNEIIEDGYSLELVNICDLRIVVGNKTLSIIFDRRELGLHSFGVYDYCSTSDEEGHKLMAQIIRENEEDAYKSLVIESSENEFWINIADCTNRSAGIYHRLHEQMIEVFEPIILKFVKDNAVFDNVGLCVSSGDYGTSHVAPFLCQKLKELGLNIHLAIIESNWDKKFCAATNLLTELSCTCKKFRIPEADNNSDWDGAKEQSQNILSKAVLYLKSVISE